MKKHDIGCLGPTSVASPGAPAGAPPGALLVRLGAPGGAWGPPPSFSSSEDDVLEGSRIEGRNSWKVIGASSAPLWTLSTVFGSPGNLREQSLPLPSFAPGPRRSRGDLFEGLRAFSASLWALSAVLGPPGAFRGPPGIGSRIEEEDVWRSLRKTWVPPPGFLECLRAGRTPGTHGFFQSASNLGDEKRPPERQANLET